jgi:integrase
VQALLLGRLQRGIGKGADAATLLFDKGTHPKLVQELLGHATVSITLDTYSHVLPGMGDQTAVAMENALG